MGEARKVAPVVASLFSTYLGRLDRLAIHHACDDGGSQPPTFTTSYYALAPSIVWMYRWV